ncbi:hypothetical protein LDENG_00154600 [Lucifuga dentata]|nr:hypothetical protein LDENG_00154600 [Lucifuga dentata]
MSLPCVDNYCRQFQPNTFDASRCGSCLLPGHMHLSTTVITQEENLRGWSENQEADDVNEALSEGSTGASSDDVNGGWTYEWSLVHSLSPDWELNICDTDTQSSSPNPERTESLSPQRSCVAQIDMTRFDPSPHRASGNSWMDERRSRDRSRRTSESRGDREQESGYFSPDRRGDGERQMEEVNKRPFRYYERGHALPSNYALEPKACVPFRNVNLGVPSQRRNTDTYMQETWRSESPQRYTYHSNFRKGTDSQTNSPTRHSSVSPDRYKLPESSLESQRRSSLSRNQVHSHASSHVSSQVPSHVPSRHTSGRSSPSHRRGSVISRPPSPSRASPSHKHRDSFHLQNGELDAKRRCSRESRPSSQASNRHSLDSEKLYRNLDSISRRGSTAIQQNSYEGSQASPRIRTTVNSSANTRTRNSREVSPSRNGYDLPGLRGRVSWAEKEEPESKPTQGPETPDTKTKRAVFTLSATTSRIRRNWLKLLKQAIQNNTHQSDTSSEKENPLSQRPLSCQPPAQLTCKDSSYKTTRDPNKSTSTADHYQTECVDGDLDTGLSDLSPTRQREEGEGWDREQAKRLEERNRWFEEGLAFSEMGSRWDYMELKKGTVPVPVIDSLDSEVNRKWAEFERMSFGEMSVQSLIGAQTHQSSSQQAFPSLVSSQTYQSSPEEAEQSVVDSQTDISSSKGVLPSINNGQTIHSNTAETLQNEALFLRQQVESIKKERAAMGIEMDSPCGPEAPCRARLEAMEAAHRKKLQELQEKHTREIRELERERDRMLQSQAAAKDMEALRAGHGEEMEKARRSAGGAPHVDTLFIGQMPQADVLHKLDLLSDHYSQKSLELSHTEQSRKSRQTELGHTEREMEQLRRENQELKAKLAEEISRMRYFITGQKSEMTSLGSAERSASEVEILLRAKENEVQHLKKEISRLQNEVQSLTKEKEAAYERYKEAYAQLSVMKNLSQLEMGSLNERLKLANAALQEGARGT